MAGCGRTWGCAEEFERWRWVLQGVRKSDKLVVLDVGPCRDPSVTADRPLLGRTFESSVGVV